MNLRKVAMIVACLAVTVMFAMCDKTNDNDDNGGETGGSGVTGKRIKEFVTSTEGSNASTRNVYSYNSDGSVKRIDQYIGSTLNLVATYTNHPDGRPQKIDFTYMSNGTEAGKAEGIFTYGTFNTLQKQEITGNGTVQVFEYTFKDGRKTFEKYSSGYSIYIERTFEYDEKGKRTKTTETQSVNGSNVGTVIHTRSYNSDGTIDKITYPLLSSPNLLVTQKFTWESGKKLFDEDILLSH